MSERTCKVCFRVIPMTTMAYERDGVTMCEDCHQKTRVPNPALLMDLMTDQRAWEPFIAHYAATGHGVMRVEITSGSTTKVSCAECALGGRVA
jgi:hypothetical protein